MASHWKVESLKRSIAFCRSEAGRWRVSAEKYPDHAGACMSMVELNEWRAKQREEDLAELEAIIQRVRAREQAEKPMLEAAE